MCVGYHLENRKYTWITWYAMVWMKTATGSGQQLNEPITPYIIGVGVIIIPTQGTEKEAKNYEQINMRTQLHTAYMYVKKICDLRFS